MVRFGVVLSSGGARGVFAHTGFMSALTELNVEIRAASGCSAGAVVGGVLASGSSIDDWTRSITHVRRAQFWTPRSKWRLIYDLGFRKGQGVCGLSSTAAAVDFIAENMLVDTFEECDYPFSVVAVDLDTVEKTIIREGPLALGVMASAAIPGFYDPVEIAGRYYSDGAILDLAPAEAICCQYKLDVLLVHHVAQQDFTTEGLRNTFTQPWTMVNIMQRLIFRHRPWYTTGLPRSIHPCPCGCKAIMVVIEPQLPPLAWPLTVGGGAVLDTAHAHAIAQIEPILVRLRSSPRALLP